MASSIPRIVLVGHPNVGKSQLFNLLTGSQVAVSNYPGTTVEVAGGRGQIEGRPVEVWDTPGLYSLSAVSAEEQVTRLLLFARKPSLVIQVAEARNLKRMLGLTLELIEAGVPLVVAVNMMDEARAAGIKINGEELARNFGVPFVLTSFARGTGIRQLKRVAAELLWRAGRKPSPLPEMPYPPRLDLELRRLAARLKGEYGVSHRAVACALLHPDSELWALVTRKEGGREHLLPLLEALRRKEDLLLSLSAFRRSQVEARLRGAVFFPAGEKASLSEQVGRLLTQPLVGAAVMLLVLYGGFYRFVGGVGAGILVDWLETGLFQQHLVPLLNRWGEQVLPWPWLRELLVLDYGMLTLGLRYVLAIIMPIMFTFFLFFGFIEDSGYLPRAAYLVNFLMEKIGLSGKAVIPLTLGFGCGTLAVLVTRTLESRRERLQASLLLSLAIPCSAQLGLMLALLSRGEGVLIWLFLVLLSFLAAARLGRRLFRIDSPPFCLEIPPLRLPRPGVIIKKTASRLRWYLKEVWPLFLGISALTWLLHQTGLIHLLVRACRPVMASLGLPGEAALILIYGFLRRDYGAAGLMDLYRSGALTGAQTTVMAVVLTLFLPCVAQLAVLIREHGAWFALQVVVLTAAAAWLAGVLARLLALLPLPL
ncbi:MAG TPA: ferrous iron transport protein B [Bacillota bacterium]|nr:ferrous iron transport protein B [Bacillota bacterium]HOB87147.1 ferrous iron transport protein B [Bacillota bacterium]HPT33314.1 ferrous iron transport protein B [Bacillota bacterium]HQD05532.1 ferrous iron transport protein B [Bacillota bacterium]